jgi:hypothetical protein
MSEAPSDALRYFPRKPVRTSTEVGAVKNAAGIEFGLRDEEQAFALPAQVFEQLPFAVYVCDRAGLVRRYTTAALPSYGAGRPDSAIPMNGFADRIECSAPTAVCSRTINVPWPMCCAPVFPCANGKFTLSDRMVRAASRSLTSR